MNRKIKKKTGETSRKSLKAERGGSSTSNRNFGMNMDLRERLDRANRERAVWGRKTRRLFEGLRAQIRSSIRTGMRSDLVMTL